MKNTKHLILALLLVCGVRFLFVFLPTLTTPAPRMGDDSLVYIWKSKLDFVLLNPQLKAVENVKRLHADVGDEWLANRISMRTYGVGALLYEAFVSGFIKLGLSYKNIFLYSEVAILLFYSFASVYFLSTFLPAYLVPASLVLNVFQPDRFVSTNLCSALALFLWSQVFNGNAGRKTLLSISLMIFTYLVHPIGLVYVCIFLALQCYTFRNLKTTLLYSAVLGCLFLFGKKVFYWTEPYLGGGTGHLSLSYSDLLTNFKFIVRYILDNGFIAFVFTFSILGIVYRTYKEYENRSKLLLFSVLLILNIMASMFFVIPGYQGELSYRLIISLSLVLSGFAIVTYLKLIRGKFSLKTFYTVTSILVFMIVFKDGRSYFDLILKNVSQRTFLIEEKDFSKSFSLFGQTNSFVITESDHLFMYSLLADPQRNLLPLGMLDSSKIRNELPQKIIAVHPIPESLNTLSYLKDDSFQRRHYGFPLAKTKVILVEGIKSSIFYVKILNKRSDFKAFINSGNQIVEIFSKPTDQNDWIMFTLPEGETSHSMMFSGTRKNSWILGMKETSANENLSWPWGNESLKITFHSIDNSTVTQRFDANHLFASLPKQLLPVFNVDEFHSDLGGALFLTMIKKNP